MANTPIDIRSLDQADTVDFDDPQLRALQATEDADPEQEAALGKVMTETMEFMYSEKGLAKIAQIFKADDRPLYQQVPDIGAMILERVYNDNPEIDPTVWFGEGGMLQQMPQMLFEIAAQLGKPGTDDPDQMTAALIGMYKKAGEHILDKGDENAREEARSLGAEALMTQDDGQIATPEQYMKKHKSAGMASVPDRVNTSMLGL